MSKYIYNYDEIFEEDPDNPDQVMMTIPLEIREIMGLNEGDQITVIAEEDKIILRKNG